MQLGQVKSSAMAPGNGSQQMAQNGLVTGEREAVQSGQKRETAWSAASGESQAAQWAGQRRLRAALCHGDQRPGAGRRREDMSGRGGRRERLVSEDVFSDGGAAEEMFGEDAFEDGWGAAVVPCAVRVDDGDRAAGADAETVGLGAEDGGCGAAGEAEFSEAAFEEVP
jgi:hypothetical protein